ncbi:hypothetical protein ACFQQB_57195 [Nonomuraea rubra]|uniref:hypothetical protein n=1 Tax=Nonomuraea rubra TaxID=46180 RepID=UPI00361AEFA4
MVPVGRLSIRACLTLATAALAVAGFALVGVVADVLLRRSIEQGCSPTPSGRPPRGSGRCARRGRRRRSPARRSICSSSSTLPDGW